jgi:hypothetical protein
VCRAYPQITKALPLWQAQLKSNQPSYILNTVVALKENVTKENKLLEKICHTVTSLSFA